MTSVRPLLDTVWNELLQASVSEGLEMLEYIAALLLEQEHISVAEEIDMPKRPAIYYRGNEKKTIAGLLEEAKEQAGGVAKLFDTQVLFYSTKIQGEEKANYPTPRHIVKFMLSLLEIEPEQSFADFACGSGGFLVHRNDGEKSQNRSISNPKGQQTVHNVGIELSPSWVRLARANLAFHSMLKPETRIYANNAFSLFANPPKSLPLSFDRIAMAPPFDTRIDVLLAREAIGATLPPELMTTQGGYSSNALFTWLLLARLSNQGRGITIVPVGLLYRRDSVSTSLRQRLVQSQELEAIIALSNKTLAPYYDKPAYLLLVNKERAEERTGTWFFKIEHDGYTDGQSRDLTEEPQTDRTKNDLPFIQLIVQTNRQSQQDRHSVACADFTIETLEATEQIRGMLIIMEEQVVALSIKRYQVPEGTKEGSYLLIETGRGKEAKQCWEVLLPEELAEQITIQSMGNEQSWRKTIKTSLKEKNLEEVVKGSLLFTNGEEGQQLAISYDGRLLGSTQRWQTISEKGHDLQPEVYLPPSEVLTGPAVQLLSSIRRDQRLVTRIVDNLLGNLEIQQRLGKPLPPRPYSFKNSALFLEQFLGPEQKAIYEQIKELSEQAQGYANYFTPEQIQLEDTVRIKQTLELLEHLGLIVKVLIKDQNLDSSATYYRLITDLDVVTTI